MIIISLQGSDRKPFEERKRPASASLTSAGVMTGVPFRGTWAKLQATSMTNNRKKLREKLFKNCNEKETPSADQLEKGLKPTKHTVTKKNGDIPHRPGSYHSKAGASNHLLEHQGMMCFIQISAGKPTIPRQRKDFIWISWSINPLLAKRKARRDTVRALLTGTITKGHKSKIVVL